MQVPLCLFTKTAAYTCAQLRQTAEQTNGNQVNNLHGRWAKPFSPCSGLTSHKQTECLRFRSFPKT